jgi:hypothetical protein
MHRNVVFLSSTGSPSVTRAAAYSTARLHLPTTAAAIAPIMMAIIIYAASRAASCLSHHLQKVIHRG